MPSPFPGMDPYLERPSLWPNVHHGLISEIQAALNPCLRPRYVASVETRVYISDDDDSGRTVMVPDAVIDIVPHPNHGAGSRRPVSAIQVTEPETITLLDEEIEEAFIEIREPRSESLVTVIEVLSPTNKIVGSAGRRSFLSKRHEIMMTCVNWVEIDLLRAGTPSAKDAVSRPSDYRVIIARANRRGNKAEYWRFSVRSKLPVIGIPLKGKDADVALDLGAVLSSAYDRGSYDLRVDYGKPPTPALDSADAKWANQLLRAKKLR